MRMRFCVLCACAKCVSHHAVQTRCDCITFVVCNHVQVFPFLAPWVALLVRRGGTKTVDYIASRMIDNDNNRK